MEYFIGCDKLNTNEGEIKIIATAIKNIDTSVSFSKTTGSVPKTIKEYANEIKQIKNEMAALGFKISELIGEVSTDFTKTDQMASNRIDSIK